MSNSVDSITTEQLLPVLENMGLTVLEQSAFYKVANNRKALYISKTKRRITRIDVSGFTVSHEAVTLPSKKNGAVTGQINMNSPLALEALKLAIEALTDAKEGFKFQANLAQAATKED